MKNLYVILGSALVLCGLGYILIGRKNKENEKSCSCNCVEEEKIKKIQKDEDIVRNSVETSLLNFNNPGDLVEKIITGVMMNCQGDFSILDRVVVPKNIEELEIYLKNEGLYERYEKSLEEKYTRKD
jgi:hypothetical protein